MGVFGVYDVIVYGSNVDIGVIFNFLIFMS